MSTFSELSANILNQYQNSCMTGESIKQILQQINNLPTPERLTYQKNIIPIIYHLKCYNENKVLTKEETKEITNKFSVYETKEITNTFHAIIKKIIDDFDTFDTVYSLNHIISKLDNI